MKLITYLFFLLLPIIGFSQNELFHENYNWEENPSYLQPADNLQPMIALKDKYVEEFAFTEDNNLIEYYLEHQVLWLNSDDKIEAYNKIYLPYSSSSELLVNKARVITKQGKIIVLDDSKILTAQDKETGKQYKYFAFEGIEKGSFIEYYYIEKKYPNYKGNTFRLQSSFDKTNVEFDLYSPKNLVFDFKSYNNIPPVLLDTLSTEKLHWQLSLKELKGLQEESQSPYQASRGAIVYKLDKNLYNNTNDISSYGIVAQNIFNFYYTDLTKKEKSLIDKLISEMALDKIQNEESKIRKLEIYIKTNIYLTEGNSDELKDLYTVLDKKVANSTGLIKLYVALLNTLNIKHELVLTSNREEISFDKDFEAHNFLNEFLFYFPQQNTYLSPTETDTRYGFPPGNLTDNHGLFIKEVKIGDFKSGLGKIKFIESVDADKTTDVMIIDVDFEKDDISKNLIKLNRSFTGYYAMALQPYMNLIKEKDKEELIESIGKSMNENIQITKKEIVNDNPDLFGIKPLQFIIELESDIFTEKAGNKYLFKVGELIGSQIQMYQEKERVLPLIEDHKRSYFRTINIKIPEGYKISNLNDLTIANFYEQDGKELLSFKSSYVLKDNILSITADEHYRLNIIETAIFENYRKVINSAADFNKITLVLEPKM